jgi:glycosyltransferase involved in cell wall biosynthesis
LQNICIWAILRKENFFFFFFILLVSAKRILLFGNAPLPDETDGIRDAGGLRTDMFDNILRQSGHSVFLFLIKKNKDLKDNIDRTISTTTTKYICGRDDHNIVNQARKVAKIFDPNIAVGVNLFPSFVASQALSRNIPLWSDLNGWAMAEAQGQANWTMSNSQIPFVWRQERAVIDRCDKFSTVSTAQKYAVYGELAGRGRIRRETWGYSFVHSIPNTTRWFESDSVSSQTPLFRGTKVPKDAIVLCNIGGYNAWCDVKTLFNALEDSMNKNPLLHFVSTGGKIAGVADAPFARFLKMVEGSPEKHRFHFLGWIPTEDIPKMYTESDIGLNADIFCLETETGARNRINEMMKFGLPIITTLGSEIAKVVKETRSGEVVESGDWRKFSEAILRLGASKSLRQVLSENGKIVHSTTLSPENIFSDFVDWTSSPTMSPDSTVSTLSVNSFPFLSAGIRYWKTYGLWRTMRKGVQFISRMFSYK